jgi:hypothetical protein
MPVARPRNDFRAEVATETAHFPALRTQANAATVAPT